MKRIPLIFVCLFIVGAGLRAVNVRRPVDTTSWRESDVASIARNYVREGMNPLYPRIDWRGTGPGFTEMEFPLYPWMIAICYKLFGVHEIIGRSISFIFSLLSMLFFFKLARYMLPEKGAIIASLFFVISPLVIGISSSLQPEGLMFFCYILAAYFFIRWLDSESWSDYGIALVATALALLAKASAAHLGIFFCLLVISKLGLRALLQRRILIFGAISLLPSLLWYRHAHKLWLTYGNSMGVSNETHWAGWDLFTNSSFILGIERAELFYVWTPMGVVMVLLAVLLRTHSKTVKYSLYWLLAIVVYYLLAARTTGDEWAVYYHVVSIPAAGLLIGCGAEAITHLKYQRSLLYALSIASVVLIAVLGVAGLLHLSSVDKRLVVKLGLLFGLSVVLLASLLLSRNDNVEILGNRSERLNTVIIFLAGVCMAATCLYELRTIRDNFQQRHAEGGLHTCAQKFGQSIPKDVLIVASGGACLDPTGFPVAYNSSYMFYWLDRKGFNICVEQQSIAALNLLSAQGAKYFIAEKNALKQKPLFDEELHRTFPLVMECEDAYLFELRQPQMTAQSGNR